MVDKDDKKAGLELEELAEDVCKNHDSDSHQLLKKLPALHENFFKKKRRFFGGYTTARYFVIKSRYLLCFGRNATKVALDFHASRKAKKLPSDPYTGPHSILDPDRIIDLNACTLCIEDENEKNQYLIKIENSKGRGLILNINDQDIRDNWLKYLRNSSIRPKLSDFEIIKSIGKGAFGEVYLSRHIPSNTLVALKRAYVESSSLLRHCVEERAIFQKVSGHPYIVNLCFAFQENRALYYAQQYCSGGDLYNVLKRKGKFPEYMVKFYGSEVLLALDHLHFHNILHRDIKPENILLDDEGHSLLTDFGLSKILKASESKTYTICGTDLYYAPEMLRGCSTGHDRTLDYWQYGNLLYELCCGNAPFSAKNRMVRHQKILNEEPSYPEYLSSEFIELIQWLLKKDTKDRPQVTEDIMSTKFFSGVDWDGLKQRKVLPPEWNVDEKDLHSYSQDNKPFEPKLQRLDTEWEEQLIGFDYIGGDEIGATTSTDKV